MEHVGSAAPACAAKLRCREDGGQPCRPPREALLNQKIRWSPQGASRSSLSIYCGSAGKMPHFSQLQHGVALREHRQAEEMEPKHDTENERGPAETPTPKSLTSARLVDKHDYDDYSYEDSERVTLRCLLLSPRVCRIATHLPWYF